MLGAYQVNERKPVDISAPTGLGCRTTWGLSGEPGHLDAWLRNRNFMVGTMADCKLGSELRQAGLGK